jgi:hypothetical protein
MNTKHTLMTIGVGIIGLVTFAGTANAAPLDLTAAKAKCDTAITERLTELTKLTTRVNGAKALTADHKSTVGGILSASTSGLNDLKSKIDADTDGATLKADCGQITAGFRIYALRAPQVRLALAGDRQATVLAKGNTIVPKLEAAIQKAATNGKDVADATAKLDDMKAKLADASNLLNGVVDSELTVTPEQWNANHGVLSGPMQSLKTSQADLKAALADAKAIIADLKA